MMREEFVHLKLHTEYSLLEGVGKIEEYLDRAKKLDDGAMSVQELADVAGVGYGTARRARNEKGRE